MSALAGLRIGIVTPRLELVGGTEIYLQRLLAVQKSLGAEVTVFTRESAELGESLHPLRRPSDSAVAESADRIVASCDIVEFHGCAPLPLLRALRGRKAALLYVHTAELTCPAGSRSLPRSGGICARAPGVGCLAVDSSQGCLCNPDGKRFPLAQRLRAPLRGRLSRAALEQTWGTVFNSFALESLFQQTIGVPGRSYVLQPPLPSPLEITATRRPNRLLFCGRLIRAKGVREAIAACAALPGSELVIAGDGPEAPSARGLADKLGVSDRVQFRGWLDAAALAVEMASASCMLMPGRWFEAWGMTGPEAISHGCAVAAWDTGGVKEWCRGPWGNLVRYGDQSGLQVAAKSLLENPAPENERAGWRDSVLSQWGTVAFGQKYAAIAARAAERAKANRVIRVTHLERKPMPGFHSIEKLFATVRRTLPGEIDVRVARSPHDNGGLLKRMANSLAAARVDADVAHVVGDSHYLALATDAKRTVLTVHDCISLHRTSGLRRAVLKRVYFTGPVSRAAVTTAISPGTVTDLSAQAGIDAGRIRVTPCCVSDRQSVTAQPGSSSVLLVGTLPHKNLERTITALKGTGLTVHVVGELSPGQLGVLKDSGLDWRNSTGLDDAGMAQVYADAGMLVFASTFEGFGLPIVEAQAAGVPVVTSALVPMDWVAGDGALLVDPTSEAAIREAVTHVAESEPLRQQLRERGLKNVQRFLPDAVAKQYADIYRELAT